MKNKLQNSVIAITGAGSGIGRSLAIECAKHGAHLAISDINFEAVKETEHQVRTKFPDSKIDSQQVNVAERAEVENWANKVVNHYGSINVIINNAGVALSSSIESIEYKDFEWLMNINFWGVVYGSKAFLSHITKSKWGHIVNISSLFGLISTPNTSSYNAAKFAVRGFTESLRIELLMSHPKIGVSCVHPGGIKTNIVNSAREGDAMLGAASRMTSEQRKNEFNQKRAKTTPERAAEIIVSGIIDKKPRILVGNDARLLDKVQRLFPVMYQKIVVKVFS